MIGTFLGFIIKGDFFKSNPVTGGNIFALKIIQSNSMNFLLYLLIPIFSPLFQAMDLIRTSFSITIGIRSIGLINTLNRLLPHALLEIPNLIFYQGISQWILFNLVVTKDIRLVMKKEKSYLIYYVASYIVLIIAALIEGYWG